MTKAEYNDRLLLSLLTQQASNRADAAGKMFTAVNRAATLDQARVAVAEILTFMRRVDELHEEQYRLKARI